MKRTEENNKNWIAEEKWHNFEGKKSFYFLFLCAVNGRNGKNEHIDVILDL
jgi:hypothetical protein